MTATRIVRPATLAAVGAAAVWGLSAALLWRTKVPADLRLPSLHARTVFGSHAVTAGARFDRFFEIDSLLATLARLVTLVVLARRGSRLARSLGLGPVNAGIVTGVFALTVVWAVGIPFAVAASWWSRRHGILRQSWASILTSPFPVLLRTTIAAVVLLAIVLLLARLLPRLWWVPVSVAVLALAVAVQFVTPYAERLGTHPLRSRYLIAQVGLLERREHVGTPIVRVAPVRTETTAANAESTGIGPSRTVFVWDTMLDGRFSRPELRFVLAHELGHHARRHIWKGLAWGALIGVPILAAVAFVTGRRGGLRNPGTVPLGLLVVAVAVIAVTPLALTISRRYEAEADWVALNATHDPAAARGLFQGFVKTNLENPDPPWWVHVFLEDHPSPLVRVEQAAAWSRLRR
jgi:Zn-dependent protease with chaperone function